MNTTAPDAVRTYLDYNATTPVDPHVLGALLPFLGPDFGNPSSDNAFGHPPKAALRVVLAAARSMNGRTPHVITQATEHPAVLAACRALQESHGVEVTYLPVDGHGLINPDDVSAAITPRTVLVTIMHANDETGTVQPQREIADMTQAHGMPGGHRERGILRGVRLRRGTRRCGTCRRRIATAHPRRSAEPGQTNST